LTSAFPVKKYQTLLTAKASKTFKKTVCSNFAIEREFEIIGEALHRLTRIDEATLAQKIPEYRKIIDFRNIIAHGYDIIDEAAMWDFAVNRVPELSVKVDDY